MPEARIDLLEDGDRERRGLPGAGLRLGEKIVAFLEDRDRPVLHRCRRHEAEVRDRAEDVGVDIKLAEASLAQSDSQSVSGFGFILAGVTLVRHDLFQRTAIDTR